MYKRLSYMFKKILAFALLFFAQCEAMACTCVLTPIENDIKTTKYIIQGRVKSLVNVDTASYRGIGPFGGSYEAILTIDRTFKWKRKKLREIQIHSDFSNCHIYYKVGEEYILFLIKKKGKYYIRTCSYSERIENGAEVLSSLERHEKNK